MIWVHCGDQGEVQSTASLALRLSERGEASDILVTAPPELAPDLAGLPSDLFVAPVPTDSPQRCRAFLDEWGPKYLIWNGGTLRPALLRSVERAKIPATLMNARNNALFPRGVRWMPGAAKQAVAAFNQVFTADGATATRLTRSNVARDKVEATGPVLEEPVPLPFDQNEYAVMAEAVGTRPAWLAADVVDSEVIHMAAAHLAASRKSHRLLMLLTPRDPENGPAAAEILREAGLSVGLRSDGDDPLAEHQAYVADLPGELGLWYRIAPLTFIGGTLSGGGASSPFDPTMLGSAIVYGTHLDPHKARFERLAQSQAGREVRSTGELGIAIGSLISPETTARMALAGWTEITRNAETINQIVHAAIEQSDQMRALQ